MPYSYGRRLILVCALGVLPSCGALQAAGTNATWSYDIADGTEKSSRAYLLVYEAGTDHEVRFNVRSQCSKPHRAEGTYGKCTHSVHVEPLNKTYSLATGEDVVLVQFTWDAPVILGTIEYGCCAGPDTAAFYTEDGRYLGKLYGHAISERTNCNNVIARTYDIRNGTRYGNRIYLLVLGEKTQSDYTVLVFEKYQEVGHMPIRFSNSAKNRCEDWYIKEFTAYGDRKDITLELQGYFCANTNAEGTMKIRYSCKVLEDVIACEVQQQ